MLIYTCALLKYQVFMCVCVCVCVCVFNSHTLLSFLSLNSHINAQALVFQAPGVLKDLLFMF